MDAPRVLIVADDLTGAMDAAGPFAQRGLSTAVVAEPLDCDVEAVEGKQVVSLNTASRHLAPEVSAQRVEKYVRRFAMQRFDIVFKKIDSTLRGNVVSETLALMRACSRNAALVAPAFPAQGRTVRDGIVHVNSVPLPQTSFARDALSPPPSRPLPQVFGEVVGAKHVTHWRPEAEQRSVDGVIVIADSRTDEDLSQALAEVSDRLDRILLVGSAGFSLALARTLGERSATTHDHLALTGPVLFVVGSRAPQSRQQVERLQAEPGTVVLELPNGVLGDVPDLGTAMRVVLVAVADPISGDGDPTQVAKGLALAAIEVARRSQATALVATGGDTAIAVLEASGCAVLDVLGDLMPGIPFARLQAGGRRFWLVTKAGGFGERDTLLEIARRLQSSV